MSKYLLKNATIINEGQQFKSDLLIHGKYIEQISKDISDVDAVVIDLDGKLLIPGMIDDQVHFREPGLTHKANISTESRAAIAGGITSFIEMPNTIPNATTIIELNKKFDIASSKCFFFTKGFVTWSNIIISELSREFFKYSLITLSDEEVSLEEVFFLL